MELVVTPFMKGDRIQRTHFTLNRLYLGIAVLLSTCACGWTQTNSGATLQGRVLDSATQHPLPFVNIMIEGSDRGAVSDSDGRFILSDLPPARIDLQLTYIGYAPHRLDDLNLSPGLELDLGDIYLEVEAVHLSEVVVTPGSFSVMGNAPLSRQTLTEEEIKNMSYAEDITRAVARLPGVSSNDFSSKFTVRGGETDEVLITLDGMELYEPFHQRDFAGGLFSIVDIDAIQGVDLLTGGFPAEYGNRQSAVFAMTSRDVQAPRTELGLSIMNARLYREAIFAGGRGEYLVSLRRGMLDKSFQLIGEEENMPSFHDELVKVSYQLSLTHTLSTYLLNAGDRTAIRDIAPEGQDVHDTRYNNLYAWTTLESVFSPALLSRTTLYGAQIWQNRQGHTAKYELSDKLNFDLSDKRDFQYAGLKQEWRWELSDHVYAKAGFELRSLRSAYDYGYTLWDIRINADTLLINYSDSVDLHIRPDGVLGSVYFSGRARLTPKLFLETGLRHDQASYSADNLWSPRISLAYAFSANTFLRAAWGRYYQIQSLNDLDVNHATTSFDPAQLSTHSILGFEHVFQRGLKLRTEAYLKEISNLSPNYQNLRDPWEVFPEARNDQIRLQYDGARSAGLEVYLVYDVGKRFSWWLNYALANTKENITAIDYAGLLIRRTGWLPRINNQRHTLNLDVNYRPNERWHLNLSWQYYEGWPMTIYDYNFQYLDNGDLHFYPEHQVFRGKEYPPYHRMDLRANRHFQLARGEVSAFVHIINLYNRENLRKFDLDVTDDSGNTVPDGHGGYIYPHDDKMWFGILPVIGVSWNF